MKRQIILVRCHETIDYSDSSHFIDTVGEWDEVTDEEYMQLYNMRFTHDYVIIERNSPSRVNSKLRTPRDYIDEFKRKNKTKTKDAQKLSEEKKLERKRKQLEKRELKEHK